MLRIFVVGFPRSGTTLVQSLLAAHPDLTSFTESHFFSRHFSKWRRRTVLRRDPSERARQWLAENAVGDQAEEPVRRRLAHLETLLPSGRGSLWSGMVRAQRTEVVAHALLDLIDAVAAARGAPSWVEKTPMHLRFAGFLERLHRSRSGQLRFVHVVRQGTDAVRSLVQASETWDRPYNSQRGARRWNRDLKATLDRADSDIDSVLLYEQLLEDPEPTLQRLLARLGLPWHPQILDNYANQAESLVASNESWKTEIGRPLRPPQQSSHTASAPQFRSLDPALYLHAAALAERR